MPGKVIQGHAKYEAECKNCHEPFNKAGQTKLCKDCHKEVAKDLNDLTGYHGKQAQDKSCHECHAEHKGRAAKIAEFDHAKFDHNRTDYPLKDSHANSTKVKCAGCHKPGKKYRDAPSRCIDCHKKDDVHKGNLGKECQDCHAETRWKKIRFDHSKTRFPLLGKHFEIKCKACHARDKYRGVPLLCYGCHKKDDVHKGSQSSKCDKCHDEKSWKKSKFDHDKETDYPLLGKHKTTKCEACHKTPKPKDGTAEKLPTACIGCHKKDDTHKGRYGQKCESCHVEKDWKTITFDHERDAKYALKGKHASIKCVACHKAPLYSKPVLKTECLACHKKDDKHKGRYGAKCETCHVEKDWKTITFDHDRDTKYPLVGGHKKAKCDSCHTGKLTDKLDQTCLACHKKDDTHKGRYGAKCESCHVEKDWKTITFDHDKDTKYPLLGGHKKAKCDSCHKGKLTDKLDQACVACHKKDDKHRGTLGAKCETCHKETDWKTINFDHDRDTKYPLKDRHRGVSCDGCHAGKMSDTPKTCIGCHKKDDKHKGSMETKCERCHSEASWSAVSFDHDRDTKFVLKETHRFVKCESCHVGKLAVAGDTCVSCHKKSDVHGGRFGDKCETCHTEFNWQVIVFDHDRDTKYPLKDSHRKVKCDNCHLGKLADVQQTCIGCHKKNDVHEGRYGIRCETCHAPSVWKTITFDHDRDTKYPLKDKHKEVKCDSCHKSWLADIRQNCVSCHRKDDVHKGRYGEKCEPCHKESNWKDIIFDHERDTKYTLREKHREVKCDSCHKGDLYKVKMKTNCVACHLKDDKHKGHFSEKCEPCHNEKNWKTITFAHDRDTKYPLKGKHAATQCEECHEAPLYSKPPLKTTCISCHKIDDKHDGQEGPRCENCHNESDWKLTKFDHSKTQFPLLGKHQLVECKKCHLSVHFKDAKKVCIACHEKDDVHKRLLGVECERCHNARAWRSWDFDHDKTRFKLDGGHKGVACIDCHSAPAIKDLRLPIACYTCHRIDDVHDGSFGKQCERCHVTSEWALIRPEIVR